MHHHHTEPIYLFFSKFMGLMASWVPSQRYYHYGSHDDDGGGYGGNDDCDHGGN